MDAYAIGAIGFALLIVLTFVGVPVAITAFGIGMVGLAILTDWNVALTYAGKIPFTSTAKFSLSVIPLFLLMGHYAAQSGIVHRDYAALRLWFAAVPGGLAIATTMASAGMGSVSGSTVATAALMGRVAIPEMLAAGYRKTLATGSVAAAGTLASMILPSIIMVVHAMMTETSIGSVLMAGVIPGFLTAIVYCVLIYVWARMHPQSARRVQALPP